MIMKRKYFKFTIVVFLKKMFLNFCDLKKVRSNFDQSLLKILSIVEVLLLMQSFQLYFTSGLK